MRLIVYLNNSDQFINIAADSIERQDEFIFAYSEGKLVGVFDVGVVAVAYLSEKK